MRIGILGPLAVLDGGSRPVAVTGARLRRLLTRLALDARNSQDLWIGVSRDLLITS